MPFQPEVNQELVIDGVTYRFAEHPWAPGIPYGQEGRQAIVYQLAAPSPAVGEGQEGSPDRRALKVFKPRYRLPALAGLADKLASFAVLPGLAVCHRTVLTAHRHADLLRQHPDLIYAVLMPWIEGPTWMEVLLQRQALAPEQSLALARSLAEILAGMEEHGLAHCDLSGPNVLLPGLLPSPSLGRGAGGEGTPLSLPGRGVGGEGWVALVDVEQLYGPDLRRPELLPGGSPGYAHKTAPDGLWGSTADRFAGAVLLGEMLGWCDARVREASWGENYFDPQEMQRETEHLHTLVTVLQERWGTDVAGLFERAWRSEVLTDCATFGEWLVMIPERVPVAVLPRPLGEETREETEMAPDASEAAVRALMKVALRLEALGNLEGALENYRQAQAMVAPGSGLSDELWLIVQDLEAKREAQTVHLPPSPAEEEESEDIVVPEPAAVEEANLDALFDDGLAACQREKWARAKELLAEVVRRQPDYERDGQQASSLLAEVARRPASSRRRVPGWAWAAIAGVLVLLIVGGGLALFFLRTPAAGATRTRHTDGMVMVYVPAGPFLMGSDPATDPSAYAYEQPQHQVNLSAFWIDRTEVTNEQYEACVRAGECATSPYADDPAYNGARFPVVGASWENARAYCRWAGGDLPTEAQWEKAARSSDGRIYPWGNEFGEARANFCDANCSNGLFIESTYNDGYAGAAPVDAFETGASPYGALQMAGNVWEWTLDCFDGYFYRERAATADNPVNDHAGCGAHVLRGGSWYNARGVIRCAYRNISTGLFLWDASVGFRCVLPATSP